MEPAPGRHRHPTAGATQVRASAAAGALNAMRPSLSLLGHWEMPNRWTNGDIEGVHPEVKQLKRHRDGFRHRDRYRRQILRSFRPVSAVPQLLTSSRCLTQGHCFHEDRSRAASNTGDAQTFTRVRSLSTDRSGGRVVLLRAVDFPHVDMVCELFPRLLARQRKHQNLSVVGSSVDPDNCRMVTPKFVPDVEAKVALNHLSASVVNLWPLCRFLLKESNHGFNPVHE